jgi:hypothetical protein
VGFVLRMSRGRPNGIKAIRRSRGGWVLYRPLSIDPRYRARDEDVASTNLTYHDALPPFPLLLPQSQLGKCQGGAKWGPRHVFLAPTPSRSSRAVWAPLLLEPGGQQRLEICTYRGRSLSRSAVQSLTGTGVHLSVGTRNAARYLVGR